MPYISQQNRDKLDPSINNLIAVLKNVCEVDGHKAGKVNYTITKILDSMYKDKGYEGYNSADGVLINVLLEYYRRRVVPYEDEAKTRNGEVYE
jgi:hypothetical protein